MQHFKLARPFFRLRDPGHDAEPRSSAVVVVAHIFRRCLPSIVAWVESFEFVACVPAGFCMGELGSVAASNEPCSARPIAPTRDRHIVALGSCSTLLSCYNLLCTICTWLSYFQRLPQRLGDLAATGISCCCEDTHRTQ